MSSLRIDLLNFVRHVLYKLYRVQQKYLKRYCHIYDMQTIDIINKLPKDANCIDVGANKGQLLYYMVKRCTKGNIIAFEPLPVLATYLRKKYRSVDVRTIALSDTGDTDAGETVFYYIPNELAISSLKKTTLLNRSPHNIQEIKVHTVKLEDAVGTLRVDFIKIDAEGAEYKILSGAEKILHRDKPLIIFECYKGSMQPFGSNVYDLFMLLIKHGYKVSTMRNYLGKKPEYTMQDFVISYDRGYDTMFIAY